MPNYCQNTIIIKGKSLPNFIETMEKYEYGYHFEFNQTIPMPEEYVEDEWMEWRLVNWGTKWDAIEQQVEIQEDKVEIKCKTAWSPPLEWAKRCVKKYEELKIEIGFYESGQQFYGIIKNGMQYMMEITDEDFKYGEDGTVYDILDNNLKHHLDHYDLSLGL